MGEGNLKSKILFTVLLISIVIIGFNGTDIANSIFGINDIKQNQIPKSSVKSSAVYMSSYDEISFDPMGITDALSSEPVNDEPNDKTNITYGSSSQSPFTLSYALELYIRNVSLYSDKTAYSKPDDSDISKEIYVDSNGYFFIKKHKYYNIKNEVRYVDMIYSSNSYEIIYLNFYDDAGYSPTSVQIQKGVNRLKEYSELYFNTINDHYDIYSWIYDSYTHGLDNELAYTDELHFDASLKATPSKEQLELDMSYASQTAGISSSVSGGGNPLVRFFKYVLAPSLITFTDYDQYDFPSYGEVEYDASLTAVYQLFSPHNIFYNIMDQPLLDNADYASYNGRIYLSMKNNYIERYVIIYNIAKNEIEGFFVKPTQRFW